MSDQFFKNLKDDLASTGELPLEDKVAARLKHKVHMGLIKKRADMLEKPGPGEWQEAAADVFRAETGEEPPADESIVGHFKNPNGTTVSIIDDGYGREQGLLEMLAWYGEPSEKKTIDLEKLDSQVSAETGTGVAGWVSPELAKKLKDAVAALPAEWSPEFGLGSEEPPAE